MSEVYEQSLFQPLSDNKNNYMTLLVKDPHWLYTYWEKSDDKKNYFINEFGHDLWEKSIPVLKITNVSRNMVFYIKINDFSNDWYINIPESNCMYMAEVGRRISDQFFISLGGSNCIIAPGDDVSTDTAAYFANHKILRNGTLELKSGKIYETYDFKQNTDKLSTPSSLELYGISLLEAISGVSSTLK